MSLYSICLDVNKFSLFLHHSCRINIANVQTLAIFPDNYCYSSQRCQNDLIKQRALHRHSVNVVKKWFMWFMLEQQMFLYISYS